ncbi:MAG: glutathione S-transferase [Marinicaulis sp.]|nr:glutathione S-transferase [Marinicaulis sp.]NNL88153.1 glutathione S-transferase [Marinicaulis sp.]
MIIVHHLENSRSQRVLWLLEELGEPYEVKRYDRDKKTNLAPAALLKVHPLGKSPVIEENGKVIAETGTIFEYLLKRTDNNLRINENDDAYWRHQYWLHAAEGSFAPMMIIALLLGRIENAPLPFFAKPIAKKLVKAVRNGYVDHTTKALYDYAEDTLGKSEWLCGEKFSAADIIMSFPFEAFSARGDLAKYPNITGFLKRIHARPGYKAALESGGPYGIGR